MRRKKEDAAATVEIAPAPEPEGITIVAPELEPPPKAAPDGIINRGPMGWVKVRATANIGEPDEQGNMIRHKPGDEFLVREDRAHALAGLTTRV